MRFPTVICAICHKPVDRLVFFDDHTSGDRVLRVHCHGDFDEMRLGRLEFLRMTEGQIRELNESRGVAFQTKRIPA